MYKVRSNKLPESITRMFNISNNLNHNLRIPYKNFTCNFTCENNNSYENFICEIKFHV